MQGGKVRFQVLAIRGRHPPTWREAHAESRRELEESLRLVGEAVIAVRASGWPVATFGWRPSLGGRAHRDRNLAVLSTQLSVLLRAGLGLVESMEALHANTGQPAQERGLEQLLQPLRGGRSFSDALSGQPDVYPAVFVEMMRSAERTSSIAQTLDRWANYARTVDQIRTRARAAALYPAFLLTLGTAVIGFLIFHVVPRFAGVYDTVRADLPLAARLILEWGRFVDSHAGLIVGALALSVTILGWVARLPAPRASARALVMRIPRVGPILRQIHLARLYRTLAMLLEGGIPMLQALSAVTPMLPEHLRSALSAVGNAIAEGASPSLAFSQAGLCTPVASSLLVAGERAGNLQAMFEESARFIEVEVSDSMESALRLLEPAIMTVIGLVIGAIVILMYVPIFELAGSLR